MTNNLYFPEGTLTSIVDINDAKTLVPVESVYEQDNRNIVTIISKPTTKVVSKFGEKESKIVTFEHGIQYITKISKSERSKDEQNFKVYKLIYRMNEIENTMYVPGFIHLYSKTTKTFCNIEFIKKPDILVNYQERSVAVINVEEVPDFVWQNTIKMTLSGNSELSSDEWNTLYFNGLLVSI